MRASRVSASPTPIRSCGARVAHTVALGSSARPPRPPASRTTPAAARARPSIASDATLRDANAASGMMDDGGRGLDRAEAPALDQQQDDQEQRGGERCRDQGEGHVRRDVRAAGRPQLGLDRVRAALPHRESEERGREPRRERDLDEEDRLPGDELGHQAADSGPQRRADGPRARPRSPPPRARNPSPTAAAPAPRTRRRRRRRPGRSGRPAVARSRRPGRSRGWPARRRSRPAQVTRAGPRRRAAIAAGSAASARTTLKATRTQVTSLTETSSSR